MASQMPQEEMMPLNTTDVESDSPSEETAPARRFRAPTKVVLAAALLGVVVLAAVGVQMNGDHSNSDTETDAWDLKAITELADSDAMKDMDPKLQLFMGFMKAWGKGELNGPKCKDNALKYIDADAEMNALGVSEKVWGMKAKGADEFCTLNDKVMSLPFKMDGFKLAYPPYISGDKVIAIPSYKLKEKDGDMVSTHTEYDGQMWTIKGGKIVSTILINAYPQMLNDFVGAKTPAPNDDIKVVEAMMAAWGKGKYHGPGCIEEAKKSFTEDTIVDAVAPMQHTDGYKKYTGVEGLCAWCKYLETAPLLNFKIDGMQSKGPGLVGMAMQSQVPLANGKNSTPTHSFMLAKVKGDKVSSMEFAFGGLKTNDDYYARQKKL